MSDIHTSIIIDETRIPVFLNRDLKAGETLIVKAEIVLYEPSITGIRGMVNKITPIGIRELSGVTNIESDERDSDNK